jgi:hypothetical protein
MTFGDEERDGRSAAGIHEGVAAFGATGMDTDSDSDSDPEARNRVARLPNKPLELTRLSCRARCGASCAGSSTPRRSADR